uniref:ATP-binding protein n=1 Tax=uncultured Sphaerochaeta sp. TaxID=886478 RepID=UPI002A0A421B
TLSTRQGPLDSSKVAREADCHLLITPFCIETEQEASSPKIEYANTLEAAFSLASKFAILNQGLRPKPILEKPLASFLTDPFFGVIGLQNVRSALALAAAGRLNILLFGPPGAGKTMMLQRLHLLLPPLSRKERMETMQIPGCKAQQIPQFELRSEMKEKDLVGGKPPQICQAHNGILVIDEIPGFKPNTLRTIQSLLDQKKCKGFPCNFFVAAAMNACPCGNLGVPEGICTCSEMQISAYWRKVGSPLLDRFDLLVPVKNENLLVSNLIPTKANLTEKIQEVRLLCLDRQEEDYRRLLPLFNRCNPRKDISLRSALSVCRTAFLIANFKGKDFVAQQDMREALLYKAYGSAKPYWQPL